MILEELTNAAFSYYSWELTPQSCKPIFTACDDCGNVRETSKNVYRALCHSCAKTGKKHPHKGKKHTEESKALMSAAKKGEKNNFFDKTHTEESKALMRAAHIGIATGENNPNWQEGISFKPYCIKFNDEYKNHIRNLFGNECFLCGMSEADNGRKLSVHHKDYNKDCGCDGTVCKCVPLCTKCHSKTNGDRDYWQCLITEMLKPVEAWI